MNKNNLIRPVVRGEQVESINALKKIVERKKIFAELIVNLYDNQINCDIRSCIYYIENETTGSKLVDAMQILLTFTQGGIETHEYLGTVKLHALA